MAWTYRDGFGLLRRVFQFRSMRSDLDLEVDAEIDYHLERTAGELRRAGATPEQARHEAERRFGDVEAHRERLRRISRRRGRKERMIGFFEATGHVARHAVRSVRSTPAVSFTVIATLALGIGANATMFGIVDRLLLRPPPHIVDPGRVVRLYVEREFIGRRITSSTVTNPDIEDWSAAHSFASVAAVSNVWGSGNTTVGHGESAVKVMGQQVSPSFFSLLGVRPLYGRFFTEQEDVIGAADVVVLGYDFWRTRYAADPDAVGEDIVLGGIAHRIVGVAPEGFTGIDLQRIDLWVPLRSMASGFDPERWKGSRGYYWLRPIARLAPGVSTAQAAAEATALHRAGRADEEHYDPEARVLVGSLIAARGVNRSDESVVARWLAAVSGIVLLIACANVANILLARGTRQRHDIGVRLALGISGRRLVGQLLVESVLLALLGGLAALVLAQWGGHAVRALLLPNVYWAEPPLSVRVLGFTFVASLLTGALAGLVPAMTAGRQDVARILTGGSRGGAARRSRLRTGMTVLQTSLSVVLLVGAGLFVKSLVGIRSVDLGFDADGLFVAAPEFDGDGLPSGERDEVFARVAERLEQMPQVAGVTTAATVPFYSSTGVQLVVPDVPEPPVFPTGGPYILTVDSRYFATMGIRILEGRGFTADDLEGAPKVTVVEQSMASAYWPDGSAVGKCMKIGGEDAECSTVVGIAEDTARQSLRPTREAQYYTPLAQTDASPRAMFVRLGQGRAEDLVVAVRREFEDANAAVRFTNVQPLRGLIDPQARSWELGASMFSAFGLLALAIAAVGLYGVMAFDVAQRTHEIGVRSALGADRRTLVRMVVRQAVWLVAGSLVLGLGVALLAGRWMESLLFEVQPADPTVLGTVLVVLLAVAALASAIPAARATRVDPVQALRTD